jgi:hypothetical protein
MLTIDGTQLAVELDSLHSMEHTGVRDKKNPIQSLPANRRQLTSTKLSGAVASL